MVYLTSLRDIFNFTEEILDFELDKCSLIPKKNWLESLCLLIEFKGLLLRDSQKVLLRNVFLKNYSMNESLQFIEPYFFLEYSDFPQPFIDNCVVEYSFNSLPQIYKESSLYHHLTEHFDSVSDYESLIPNELSEKVYIESINQFNDPLSLYKILRACDFWGFPSLPIHVYEYIIHNTEINLYFMLENPLLSNTVKYFSLSLLSNDIYENKRLAIEIDNLLLFQYLIILDNTIDQELFSLAITLGRFNMLKYLHELQCDCYPKDACNLALKGCHYECFLYLHKTFDLLISEETSIIAAELGHIKCLEYLHQKEVTFSIDTFLAVGKSGSIECLLYLKNNFGFDWDKRLCSMASKHGHYKMLQYLYEQGCPWDENTCAEAARSGHINCLQYACEKGCYVSMFSFLAAAEGGSLSCITYLHERNCPWNAKSSSAAAQNGHLDCLKYLHDNGCPWDAWTCIRAAIGNHIDCLKYAVENKCPLTADIPAFAAQYGSYDCLVYLYEIGCPWDDNTCSLAASNGHLACLMFAHENGCPWSEDSITNAVLEGRLKCVKYMVEHGYKFTNFQKLLSRATRYGVEDLVTYLLSIKKTKSKQNRLH